MSVITKALLTAAGGSEGGAALYAEPLAAACDTRGIAGRDLVPFLANILNETAGLSRVVENTYYSKASHIRLVFPRIFKTDEAAQACACNAAALADKVYGGWQGRGLAQLTGIANYTAYAVAVGRTLDEIRDYVLTPIGAADSAAWYFVWAGCLRMNADLLAITRAWEGGVRPIGWSSVQAWSRQVVGALNRASLDGAAPQPVADKLMDKLN